MFSSKLCAAFLPPHTRSPLHSIQKMLEVKNATLPTGNSIFCSQKLSVYIKTCKSLHDWTAAGSAGDPQKQSRYVSVRRRGRPPLKFRSQVQKFYKSAWTCSLKFFMCHVGKWEQHGRQQEAVLHFIAESVWKTRWQLPVFEWEGRAKDADTVHDFKTFLQSTQCFLSLPCFSLIRHRLGNFTSCCFDLRGRWVEFWAHSSSVRRQ